MQMSVVSAGTGGGEADEDEESPPSQAVADPRFQSSVAEQGGVFRYLLCSSSRLLPLLPSVAHCP